MRNLHIHPLLWIVWIVLGAMGVACSQALGAPTLDPKQIVTSLTPISTTPEPPPVSGYITNVDGKPIAGARVIVEVLTPGVPVPAMVVC